MPCIPFRDVIVESGDAYDRANEAITLYSNYLNSRKRTLKEIVDKLASASIEDEGTTIRRVKHTWLDLRRFIINTESICRTKEQKPEILLGRAIKALAAAKDENEALGIWQKDKINVWLNRVGKVEITTQMSTESTVTVDCRRQDKQTGSTINAKLAKQPKQQLTEVTLQKVEMDNILIFTRSLKET